MVYTSNWCDVGLYTSPLLDTLKKENLKKFIKNFFKVIFNFYTYEIGEA